MSPDHGSRKRLDQSPLDNLVQTARGLGLRGINIDRMLTILVATQFSTISHLDEKIDADAIRTGLERP
jgi:hypothetical protein